MKNFKIKDEIRNIIKIYFRDIRTILTNYVTFGIILALIILPSLYAWFNIKACWDPYSNTKGLSVAVVNKDRGASYKETSINAGSEIISQLKSNNKIGWKFTDGLEALNGIRSGKYYATITIPENFSRDLISVVTEEKPIRAELIYSVNEKKNAIATKITDKGAASLRDEINKEFIKTSSNMIFNFLNKFGTELEKNKPALQRLADTIIDLDNKMPEISRNIENTYSGAIVLKSYIKTVQGNIPVISDTLNRTLSIVKTNDKYLSQVRASTNVIAAVVKADEEIARGSSDTIKGLLSGAQQINTLDTPSLIQVLNTVKTNYVNSSAKISNDISMLQSMITGLSQSTSGPNVSASSLSGTLNQFKGSLANIKNKIDSQANNADNAVKLLQNGSNTVGNIPLKDLIQDAQNISNQIDSLINQYDNVTAPAINSAVNSFSGISQNTITILEGAQNNLPVLNNLLGIASGQTSSGIIALQNIKNKFPSIESDLHSSADRLRKLNADGRYEEIVRMLEKNAIAESDFLSNPIDIKENRIFPIPNYGSAMSPFYTTLAIWVGAFILLSLLSVEPMELKNGTKLSSREKFLGRFLTFSTITTAQALVVSIGDMLLLKTYVLFPILFVIFSVYVSIVFTMITYTLVSVLNNIGKAIVMILMVLQVSASGGTFPVELIPPFFKNINPLLPFTYSIGGMRELVAGIVFYELLYNIILLLIYFVVFLIIGILFKERANKINERFVKQFKSSGLTEE